jgi:hypothetical protein
MQPVVALPDAEMVVLDYLRPRMASTSWPTAKLGTVVPATRPFVQVRRVGGSSELPGVDAPRLDLVVYHDTDHNRMALALACWTLLKAAASDRTNSGVITYTATTLGPRQMPDPTDSTKRVVMFTVDVLTRLP